MVTETVLELEKKAQKHFEQGNLHQALLLFQQLDPKKGNPEFSKCVFTCYQLLLRKYWRQGKAEQLIGVAQSLGKGSLFQLPHARLLNANAVEKVASTQEGLQSTLAACSLEEDLKTALLLLRKEVSQKEMAEGWLCLFKGDAEKALTVFKAAPTYSARIGQGISYLLLGKIEAANALLQHLKPFSSRFPSLHRAMGWDNPDEVNEQIFSHYLFKASLKDLIDAEKKMLPHQKNLHGWISLRIGDHLFYQEQSKPTQRNYARAIQAWEKGSKFNPELKIDVLKRLFIVSKEPENPLDCGNAFKELYCHLHKKAPELAMEFMAQEDFILNSPLQAQDIQPGNSWIVNPPPKELQYLWLTLIYSERIYPYSQLLFMGRGTTPEGYTSQPWSFWESLFNTLDPSLESVDRYQECKQIISKLHLQRNALRQSLVKRLEINPLRKKEFFPLYVREFSRSREYSFFLENKGLLEQELKELLLLFPTDYDLLRFSILSKPFIDWQKAALNYAPLMSKPLAAVFQLHLAVDYGIPLKKCREMIPDISTWGQDEEADWRLFAILNTPHLKFPKKELVHMGCQLAGNGHEKLHRYHKNMWDYYEISPPLSLLKKWEGDVPDSWEPSYHLGLYYINHQKFDEAMNELIAAEQKIDPSSPERIAIQQTLDCCSPMGNPQELIQHFMDWMEQLS